MRYSVAKVEIGKNCNPLDISDWKHVEFVKLENVMGENPAFFPETSAALRYDNKYLYGCFIVKDKYIVTKAIEHMQHVWKDSCVELFFTPGNDISKGYYNLEMNCIGKIYMQHQITKGNGVKAIDKDDLNSIKIKTSIDKPVLVEETGEKEWHLIFAYPYEVMRKYHDGFIMPAPGVIWKANFNKCADESSNPHWITWNKVELPKPQFHRPDFFGELHFT